MPKQGDKRLNLTEEWIDLHGMEKFNHEGSSNMQGGSIWPKNCKIHLGNDGIHGQVMRTQTQYEGFSVNTFYG